MEAQLGEFLPRSEQLGALAPHALGELALAADRFSLRRGETLFRQGMKADALYIVTSGQLEIAARIPGDEAAAVSTIEPGEVVGEFALLDDGLRSANVAALTDSEGLRIPKARFAALLADGKPWTLDLIDALRGLVAIRTRATLERIAQAGRYDLTGLRGAGSAGQAGTHDGSDVVGLFAALGRLGELGPDGAAQVAAAGSCMVIPRGCRIGEAGAPPGAVLLVLRGALRTALPRPEGHEQVMVHGPSDFVGLVGLFDGGPQPLAVQAAEESIVLQLPAEEFAQLRASAAPHALALLAAIGRQLVRDQRRANRHLGRAVSLATFNHQSGRSAA
jgi:CRP-like cAMP-binding protein